MKLIPFQDTLETLMQCLPSAPFKRHLKAEIEAYGQVCRDAVLSEIKAKIEDMKNAQN